MEQCRFWMLKCVTHFDHQHKHCLGTSMVYFSVWRLFGTEPSTIFRLDKPTAYGTSLAHSSTNV